MSEIVIIDSGQLALSLRVPELGMPEILSFGREPAETDPLFEIERFQAIPMARVETMIAAFETALREHLMGPLGLSRVTPGSGDDGESPIEMRTLATLQSAAHMRLLNRLFGALFVMAGLGLAAFKPATFNIQTSNLCYWC